MEKILDEPQIQNDAYSNLRAVIRWWEKKRLLFNICICFSAFLPTIFFYELVQLQSTMALITLSIIYLLFANLFFTIGWGIDALRYYIFSGKNFGKYKELFYLTGMLFSIGTTLLLSINFWMTFNRFANFY